MGVSPHHRVWVAVLTYGRRGRHVHEVLTALQGSTILPERILVLDNGTTSDADRSIPSTIPVEWIDLPVNLGSAGGYHRALQEGATSGADLWLLDDDNLPEPDCLEHLLRNRQSLGTQAVVVAHRPLRPEFEEIVRRGGSRPLRRNSFMAFHILGTPRGHHLGTPARQGCLPLAYFGYGGALIPSDALASGILPEPALFVYHDDSDWSHRLLAAGFSAWLVPDAHIRDLEVSWGGQETAGASPLFSHRIPSDRAWFAVRNRAWVERRLGFGGPVWHLNALAWITLQGLRALLREHRPLALVRRLGSIGRAFVRGAAGRLG